MKTFLACLIFAAIGAAVGWNINHDRYGQFEPFLGPMDYQGEVTATNAIASMKTKWNTAYPKVEVPNGNTFDFGVMEPEQEGEHIFIIKNVGDADLSLKVGASTCKCTVGELGKELLAPGEQTEVKMSWTVKTNETTFGQSAELRTNDPSQVAIRFEIRGNVVREVQLSPDEVTFGEVAAGENVQFEAKVFSFIDEQFRPGKAKFYEDEINQLANIEITEFTPSSEDGANESARQGFRVNATIRPGLKQGPVTENLTFELIPVKEEENVKEEESGPMASDSPNETEGSSGNEATGQTGPSSETDSPGGFDPNRKFVLIPVSGRIVGVLSMLPNSKLRGVSGGGYIFDFGKVDRDDSLSAKSFVSLKGREKGDTELRIGEVSPAEFVDAELAKPIGRGQMTLYGLTLTLKPGAEKVERLGMNKDDYGFVMIESNNPKVPPLKLRLKFSLSAR